VFCSGARGRRGPSEAQVIATALAGVLDPARLVIDADSRDTLQTVAAATGFARARDLSPCIACTDGWHEPRVLMLFGLFGMPAVAAPAPPPGRVPWRWWLYPRLREAAALPYDLVAGSWAALRRR
jgi:uncharacterized SAM-binding protein YcdF (DUF218 family)